MSSFEVQAGKMLYEGLKDPKHANITKMQGDLLSSRFSEVINASSLPKCSKSQRKRFIYGKSVPLERDESNDRGSTLNKIEKYSKMGLSNQHIIKNDENKLK